MADQAFNPDQYLKEKAQPAFDPDAYLRQKAAPAEEPSAFSSAVRKLAAGASYNFSDELAGGAEAAGRAIGLNGAGGPIKDISINPSGPTLSSDELNAAYARGRDKERATLKRDAEVNPGVSGMAELAGALVSPANKIAGPLGAMGGGAVIGGVNAAGSSEAKDLKVLAKDTLIGTATGAAVGKLADMATPALEALARKGGEKAAAAAEILSARAQGAERGTIKKFGQEAVRKAGRYGLDNDVVTALGNTEDKIAANEAAKKAAMDSRSAAYQQIDDAGASQFNPAEAAARVKEKVLGGKNMAHDDVKELAAALDPHLSNILSRGDQNIPLKDAQELVQSLGKKAKFDASRSNQANEVAKDVYNTVRNYINESAGKSADSIGVDGVRQAIEDANSKYASGKVSEKLLENKQAREQGNKLVGLTDTITGVDLLSHVGLPGAGAAVLGKKMLEKYGPQLAARGLDKIGAKLLAVPEVAALAEKSPAAFQSLIGHFEGGQASLPAAADNPPKGKAKWVQDGLQKLQDHAGGSDQETLDKVKGASSSDPAIQKLLIAASDLKPGSKAMEKILAQIKEKGDR